MNILEGNQPVEIGEAKTAGLLDRRPAPVIVGGAVVPVSARHWTVDGSHAPAVTLLLSIDW